MSKHKRGISCTGIDLSGARREKAFNKSFADTSVASGHHGDTTFQIHRFFPPGIFVSASMTCGQSHTVAETREVGKVTFAAGGLAVLNKSAGAADRGGAGQ